MRWPLRRAGRTDQAHAHDPDNHPEGAAWGVEAAVPPSRRRDGQGERRRRRRGGEPTMVPEAEFTSYYGRPIVKAPPWEFDIPAYLFAGGLAAGSSLLAAGAVLTDRPALRRAGRVTSIGGLAFSLVALVHDLGRPSRFLNMLRTVKLTSPMSVGTWILSSYAVPASVAFAAEVTRILPERARALRPVRLIRAVDAPAGVAAGVLAPPVAAYTAVLLADTAIPAWHDAFKELPAVFVSSAAVAAGGVAMVTVPTAQASPARRLAVAGATVELVAEQLMERTMGLSAETLHHGKAGRFMTTSKTLTVVGALGAMVGGRCRAVSVLAGAALVTASACKRFGVVEAGIASAADPKYIVVPQRERLEREARDSEGRAPTDTARVAAATAAAPAETGADRGRDRDTGAIPGVTSSPGQAPIPDPKA